MRRDRIPRKPFRPAACIKADVHDQRSRLLTLPPFHAFGSPILPSSIRQGIPTYIMRRYAEALFLHSIAQHSITETYVAPPVLMGLPKSALATCERLSSLRTIWIGGASVKFAQQQPLYDLLHEDACIRSVWGMTEAGWITCVQDRTRREDDSVGQPLDGFNIRHVSSPSETLSSFPKPTPASYLPETFAFRKLTRTPQHRQRPRPAHPRRPCLRRAASPRTAPPPLVHLQPLRHRRRLHAQQDRDALAPHR